MPSVDFKHPIERCQRPRATRIEHVAELLRRAAEICPRLLCVLTKVDFYPEWQRILEINKGHLRRAGLTVDILPVSSVLRDTALQSGDQPLNAESGFPALVKPDMVKPGAAVVGAGVTMDGKRIISDVDEAVAEVAGWITPRVGGVGPMTRAMLLRNTVLAASRRAA